MPCSAPAICHCAGCAVELAKRGQSLLQTEFDLCLRRSKMSAVPRKMCVWRRGEAWGWWSVLRNRCAVSCAAAPLPLGMVQGVLAVVELSDRSQHWAVPTWPVRTERSGAVYLERR